MFPNNFFSNNFVDTQILNLITQLCPKGVVQLNKIVLFSLVYMLTITCDGLVLYTFHCCMAFRLIVQVPVFTYDLNSCFYIVYELLSFFNFDVFDSSNGSQFYRRNWNRFDRWTEEEKHRKDKEKLKFVPVLPFLEETKLCVYFYSTSSCYFRKTILSHIWTQLICPFFLLIIIEPFSIVVIKNELSLKL